MTIQRCGSKGRKLTLTRLPTHKALFTALLCCHTFISSASIAVSSFETVAGTNAFAPLSQAQYFNKQTLTNISPASATATGDWTGTNIGGSASTWHWLGSGQIETITSFNPTQMTVSGSASFSREITTTSDFVSPNTVQTLYAPGAGNSYTCSFTVDSPSSLSITVQLQRNSTLQLDRVGASTSIVDEINIGNQARNISIESTLSPGPYYLRVGSGLGGLSFNQGAHHDLQTGGFTNFNFTVAVPEPSLLGAAGLAGLFQRRRR